MNNNSNRRRYTINSTYTEREKIRYRERDKTRYRERDKTRYRERDKNKCTEREAVTTLMCTMRMQNSRQRSYSRFTCFHIRETQYQNKN
jgi:hypothetical protein